MEPRRFVTNGLSRNVRSMLRARLVAEALQTDPDSYHLFTIRSQNECYACHLKSRSHCLNNCRSTVNPNARDDSIGLIEVHLSSDSSDASGGGSGAS